MVEMRVVLFALVIALVGGGPVSAQQRQRVAPTAAALQQHPVHHPPQQTEEELQHILLNLRDEHDRLNGQLNAERVRRERIEREVLEVETDLSRMTEERGRSTAACSGDNMDPQDLRNVMGYTVATLVGAGLGTAANVVSVISTLRHWQPRGGSEIIGTPGELTLGGGNEVRFEGGGPGLGVGATRVNTGMAIASTILAASATVTSAIARNNLISIRDDAAACRATFGNWY